MQAAQRADLFVAGTKEEMIGVGQQEPNGQVIGEIALGQAFYSALCADGHEDGSLDGSMRRVQQTRARTCGAAFGDHFK